MRSAPYRAAWLSNRTVPTIFKEVPYPYRARIGVQITPMQDAT